MKGKQTRWTRDAVSPRSSSCHCGCAQVAHLKARSEKEYLQRMKDQVCGAVQTRTRLYTQLRLTSGAQPRARRQQRMMRVLLGTAGSTGTGMTASRAQPHVVHRRPSTRRRTTRTRDTTGRGSRVLRNGGTWNCGQLGGQRHGRCASVQVAFVRNQVEGCRTTDWSGRAGGLRQVAAHTPVQWPQPPYNEACGVQAFLARRQRMR